MLRCYHMGSIEAVQAETMCISGYFSADGLARPSPCKPPGCQVQKEGYTMSCSNTAEIRYKKGNSETNKAAIQSPSSREDMRCLQYSMTPSRSCLDARNRCFRVQIDWQRTKITLSHSPSTGQGAAPGSPISQAVPACHSPNEGELAVPSIVQGTRPSMSRGFGVVGVIA
jgi:hypothetical protein